MKEKKTYQGDETEERSMERWHKLLVATLDVLPVGVCLTDEGGYYRMMNGAYCAIYEYDRDEMLGKHYSVIMPPDQVELANKHYARLLNGDVGIPVERKRQRKSGEIVFIEAANALVMGVEGQKMVITTVRDITERKKTEEQIRQLNRQLEQMAMVDELTGLMNRRSFFIQGEKEVSRVQRHQTPLSLLMLDVDRFKEVNDQYGHEAGDKVLQHISHILQENVREIDLVARLGGEEFSVILPNTTAMDAGTLAERIRQVVEQQDCIVRRKRIEVTVSLGVASFTQDMKKLEEILRQADAALYQAKKLGRNRVVCLE